MSSQKNTPSTSENPFPHLSGLGFENGLRGFERQIQGQQGMEVQVDNKTVINFCSNNYLGLSSHPRVKQAAKDCIDKYGFGMASVRPICGTLTIHKQLEDAIAKFHKMDEAILYPSCYDANVGLFEALLGKNDVIISDALIHASIVDGIRLCRAQRRRYKHLDMVDLEKQLIASQDKRIRMIVTDGVFSMDGDYAPLPEIIALAKKYNAVTFVDECHATGVLGESGRGTPQYFGVEGQIDIINSTLGKALCGGSGGYTVARKDVIDALRNLGRPYVFSNSLAPPIVGASLEVFKIIDEDHSVFKRLYENTRLFRTKMKEAGFHIMGVEDCPICPVFFGAPLTAKFVMNDLFINGDIYVQAIPFPVIPKNMSIIRVVVSGAHTSEQVMKMVAAFIVTGAKLKLIPQLGQIEEVHPYTKADYNLYARL